MARHGAYAMPNTSQRFASQPRERFCLSWFARFVLWQGLCYVNSLPCAEPGVAVRNDKRRGRVVCEQATYQRVERLPTGHPLS